ncbi:hypothetical protein ACOTCM_16020 [Achromobacter xylosoxidans]
MILDHDALARAAQAYLAAHRAASYAKPGPNAHEQRADAAASLRLIFLSKSGSATTRSRTQGDEAILPGHIVWNLAYSEPRSLFRSRLADAVRKARDNDQALIG